MTDTLFIVLTASSAFLCNSLAILSISFVEVDDCSANFLISSATTANPLPASPALAASIAAFRANKLVCSAMEAITSLACPILIELSFVFNIISKIPFVALLLSSVILDSLSISLNPSSTTSVTLFEAAFKFCILL
ncbi:hypothetical protein SDC9_146235 [bioreactor metagenome]|uniref:Uncharacterized protein n=1 Tax=bioreactor metagenome TaxID=1076179 RepID=A0A645EC36_9ZZZZ